jgi:hypothetical protein
VQQLRYLLLLSSFIFLFSCATTPYNRSEDEEGISTTSGSRANYKPGYPINKNNSAPSVQPQTAPLNSSKANMTQQENIQQQMKQYWSGKMMPQRQQSIMNKHLDRSEYLDGTTWMIDGTPPTNRKSNRNILLNGMSISIGSSKSSGIRFPNSASPSRRNIPTNASKPTDENKPTNENKLKSKKTRSRKPPAGEMPAGIAMPKVPNRAPTGSIMKEDGTVGILGGGPPIF